MLTLKPDVFFARGQMRVGWVEQWLMRDLVVTVDDKGTRRRAVLSMTTPQWSARMVMP